MVKVKEIEMKTLIFKVLAIFTLLTSCSTQHTANHDAEQKLKNVIVSEKVYQNSLSPFIKENNIILYDMCKNI